MIKSTLFERNEYQLIIEIGMMETNVGTSLEHIPFKIIKTPADVFFNPDFLTKDYFKLYKAPSQAFELRLEEFLYSLFFEEMTENSENVELIVSLNMFVPSFIVASVEQILKKKFQVSVVNMIPSQLAAMYTSSADSGIVVDFGFSNISFIPFFKGFVLRKFVFKTSNNGVTLFKKLYESVKKINPGFDALSFEVKIDLLNQLLISCISIPSIEECNLIEDNFEKDKDKMRNKILKYNNPTLGLYINYLENYRIANFLFEHPQSIVQEFVDFLRSLPTHMCVFLIGNIIPAGGLLLINKFFMRFRQELEAITLKDSEVKQLFPDKFFENFHFTYVSYSASVLNWAGGKLISIGNASTSQGGSKEIQRFRQKGPQIFQLSLALNLLPLTGHVKSRCLSS